MTETGGTAAFIPDTNVIERLNEEFRRRVKTQGSLPGEDAARLLLYSLVATGQITFIGPQSHAPAATSPPLKKTSGAEAPLA